MSSIQLVCLAALFHLDGQERDELSKAKKGNEIDAMTSKKATFQADIERQLPRWT